VNVATMVLSCQDEARPSSWAQVALESPTDTARVVTVSLLHGETGPSILDQSPCGASAYPAEVAGLVAFLASAGAEYCTGSIVDVNSASYLWP
jgi:3-oxoacyl-[acyl-carrier protein] reductase